MGYYTQYKLTVEEANKEYKISDIVNKIMELRKENTSKFYAFEYNLEEEKENTSDSIELYFESDDCKWYDHDEEMLELSKHFPEIIFKLEGEGEENGDMWNTYYCNGKLAHYDARIIIDPLNKSDFKKSR